FQAEDGIRDRNVTGVQTCALPIFDTWKEQFENSETEQAVLEDLQRVQSYGIQGAPALVIDQKYLIRGAQPQGVIEKTIEEIAEKIGRASCRERAQNTVDEEPQKKK